MQGHDSDNYQPNVLNKDHVCRHHFSAPASELSRQADVRGTSRS
jgi:hypothetical protein